MNEIDFGAVAGAMGGLGLLLYLTACVYHRVFPPIDKTLEAIGFGGLIAVGFHMMYGAFHAGELCHIIDDHGKLVENAEFHVKFGEHTWEIFAGGVVVVLASIHSLRWICRRPAHSHP